MLKKVMIICLALSFVFIGGIAFAGNSTGKCDCTGECPGNCLQPFTSHDSSILADNQDTDVSQDPNQDQSQEEKGIVPIQEPEQDQDKVQS
jgi:hypothetical protein